VLYGEVTVAVNSHDRFVTDEWGGAAAAARAVASPLPFAGIGAAVGQQMSVESETLADDAQKPDHTAAAKAQGSDIGLWAGPGIGVVVLPGAAVVVLRGRRRNPAPSYT
jgi:hypothetical protein